MTNETLARDGVATAGRRRLAAMGPGVSGRADGPTNPAIGVQDAMRQVWSEIAPSAPWALELSWNDAGIDSLKRLRFALRMEELLRRRMPFDALAGETTLAEAMRLTEGSAPPLSPSSLPTIFLLPGVFGDEPALADFRAAVVEARFVTLSPADVDAPLSLAGSINGCAKSVMAALESEASSGSVHLAGYSFGSVVAFEVARLIEAAGGKVGMLMLIDPPLHRFGWKSIRPPSPVKGADSEPLPFNARLKRLFDAGAAVAASRAVYWVGVNLRAYAWALGWLNSAKASTISADRWQGHRRHLLYVMRGDALRFWRPPSVKCDVTLITSRDADVSYLVRTFSGRCGKLRHRAVEDEHLHIFNRGSLALIKDAIVDYLNSQPSRMS